MSRLSETTNLNVFATSTFIILPFTPGHIHHMTNVGEIVYTGRRVGMILATHREKHPLPSNYVPLLRYARQTTTTRKGHLLCHP